MAQSELDRLKKLIPPRTPTLHTETALFNSGFEYQRDNTEKLEDLITTLHELVDQIDPNEDIHILKGQLKFVATLLENYNNAFE